MSELANNNNFSNAEGGFQEALNNKFLKNIPTFFHKYIDGTNQQGRYINENGKIFKVVKNGVPEYYDYAKDKGFVERDANGNYFYFEPLPEFKVAEIKRLEKLNYSAKDKKPPLKIKKESKSPSVRDKTPQKQFIEMPDEPPLIPCGQIREIAEPNLISEAETPTNF